MDVLHQLATRQAEELEEHRRHAVPVAAVTTATIMGGGAAEADAAGFAAATAAAAHPSNCCRTEGAAAQPRGPLAAAEQELATQHAAVAKLRQEVEELKAAGAAAPPKFASEERYEADRSTWQAERRSLETAVAEAREQVLYFEQSARMPGPVAGGLLQHSWQASPSVVNAAVTAHLQEELAAERRATAAANERSALIREEVAEERRMAMQRHGQEELSLARQRLGEEAELRQIQRQQLATTTEAAEELAERVAEARHHNAGLRGALERHQELLLRIRS